MKDLLEFVVKSLVSQPEEVEIKQEEKEGDINLDLKVAEEDMGLIIGRQGRIIKAIRNLLKTRALIENKKVQLTLEEAKK
jgi:predicted RNA-binding protein YlqC (UPF0109 family)